MNLIELAITILVTAVFSFIIAYIFFKKAGKMVRLEAYLVFVTGMIDVDSAIKKKVKIKYDGKAVSNIYKARIALVNRGNIPITKDNFVEPIQINFGEKCILSNPSEVSYPDGFKLDVLMKPSERDCKIIEIQELENLGPREKIEFELLIIGDKITPSISGITFPPRKNISFLKKKQKSYLKLIFYSLAISLLVTAFAVSFYYLNEHDVGLVQITYFAIMSTVLIAYIFIIFINSLSRN